MVSQEPSASVSTGVEPASSGSEAGEQFAQADLARVLRAISQEGPSVFYRGWIADSNDVEDDQGARQDQSTAQQSPKSVPPSE